MLEAKEKTIDGIVYSYQPLMATPARELLNDLIKRFGPAIAGAIEGLNAADLDLDQDASVLPLIGSVPVSIGSSIREIAIATDPKFHAALAARLAKQTQIQVDVAMLERLGNDDKRASAVGNWIPLTPEVREILYATNLLSEFKWIFFCLESQYADFLGPLRKASEALIAGRAMANASKSGFRKGSIGTSNESPPTSDTRAG